MFVIPVSHLRGTVDEQRVELVANLGTRAQVKHWAFVLHDKDTPAAGGPGPSEPHWQGVLHTEKDLPASRFEGWLPGCSPVRKLEGGRGALLDGVLYLSHELQPGKAQYPRSAIKASPGWDWEIELRDHEVRSARGGRAGGKGRTKVMAAVLDGHLSVREAIRRGVSNERAARIARHRYLMSLGAEDLPAVRVNFYLQLPSAQDPSGLRLAEALGRTLSVDQRAYRMQGDAVDDYDGEDVMVMSSRLTPWADLSWGHPLWRGQGKLAGARELLAVLGATPSSHSLPTKYGPTQLIHRHTVIIGTEPFAVFRRHLEGAYVHVLSAGAKEQSFLSLPVVVPVTAEDFAVQASSRFALGRGEFDQYVEVERVRLRISDALNRARHVDTHSRAELVRQIEQRQTQPILDVGDSVTRGLSDARVLTADEVLDEFADLGQPVTTSEGDMS